MRPLHKVRPSRLPVIRSRVLGFIVYVIASYKTIIMITVITINCTVGGGIVNGSMQREFIPRKLLVLEGRTGLGHIVRNCQGV